MIMCSELVSSQDGSRMTPSGRETCTCLTVMQIVCESAVGSRWPRLDVGLTLFNMLPCFHQSNPVFALQTQCFKLEIRFVYHPGKNIDEFLAL
jgi:hypothetical protein